MNKAEEILDKHLEIRCWTKTVPKHGNLYNTLLDAINEALNIPVVVGQSEQRFERMRRECDRGTRGEHEGCIGLD